VSFSPEEIRCASCRSRDDSVQRRQDGSFVEPPRFQAVQTRDGLLYYCSERCFMKGALQALDEEPTAAERMTYLAQSFPTLVGRPGVEPWDPLLLEKHSMSGDAGAAELHACRFLLGLWNPHRKKAWSCGRFELVKAMATWDDDHRQALIDWVEKPWWP
jgi:hypothetical protein